MFISRILKKTALKGKLKKELYWFRLFAAVHTAIWCYLLYLLALNYDDLGGIKYFYYVLIIFTTPALSDIFMSFDKFKEVDSKVIRADNVNNKEN